MRKTNCKLKKTKYTKKARRSKAKAKKTATMGKLFVNRLTRSILPNKIRTVYTLSLDGYVPTGSDVVSAGVQINAPYLPLIPSTNVGHASFTNWFPLVASQALTAISPLNYSKYSQINLYQRLKVYGFSYNIQFIPAGATSDNMFMVAWINDVGTYPMVNATTANQPLDQILSNPLSKHILISSGTSAKGNVLKGYVSLENVYGLTRDQFFNNQEYVTNPGNPAGLVNYNQALTQDQLVALNLYGGTVDGNNVNQSLGYQVTFKWYVELCALAFNNTIDQ